MANQAWKITAPGQVTLVDVEKPKPGPKQALIRLQAASLNYRDILVMNHDPSYPAMAKQDLIPCSDGAGVVEEAGPQSEWKAGDRVIIQPNTWTTGFDPRDFDMYNTMVRMSGQLQLFSSLLIVKTGWWRNRWHSSSISCLGRR